MNNNQTDIETTDETLRAYYAWSIFRDDIDALLAKHCMRTGETRDVNAGTRTVSIYAGDGEEARDVMSFHVTEAEILEFGRYLEGRVRGPQRKAMDKMVDAYKAMQASNAARR